MASSKELGNFYSFIADDNERMKGRRRAAAHGDLFAIKELAYFLRHGKEVKQDCREALKWNLVAASFNDLESIFIAAEMCTSGIGTEPDLSRATELYKKAIEICKKIANDRRANIIDRQHAAKKIAYTYENFFNDGHAAVKWLKKNVLLGDKSSRFTIAEIYRDGRFMEPSGADAIEWFTKILKDKTLPDHERYSAAFEIAKIFHEGKGVPRSDSEAVKYFKLSAKAGTVTARVAYNNLAKIYSKSDELTPNIGMVLHWLKKAAEVGSRRATWILAKVFRDGKFGVRQNATKALEILQDGASNPFDIINKVAAMRMIAEIYDKGLGVPEDKEKAADLYQEATSINEEWMQTINALQMRI